MLLFCCRLGHSAYLGNCLDIYIILHIISYFGHVAERPSNRNSNEWNFELINSWLRSLVTLGWPESSFGFFRKCLQKNPNKCFGHPSKFSIKCCICHDQHIGEYVQGMLSVDLDRIHCETNWGMTQESWPCWPHASCIPLSRSLCFSLYFPFPPKE